MQKKMLDMSKDKEYNKPQDDINDFVVKMDEQVPLNDTECKHQVLTPDPDDTIGTAIYHGCANRQCGLGWYIQPK